LNLRKELWSRGHRYRIHYDLPGKPDIVFISKKMAVFIDGCFWHKCPKCCVAPKSNKKYWLPKLEKNVKNDKKNNKALKKLGWKVVRIWEHEIKKDFNSVLDRIKTELK
jgi:DNA mismatch endonuclease (patch repair protein)